MKNSVKIYVAAMAAALVSVNAAGQDMETSRIAETPAANLAAAIQGELPWMNITFESGMPYAAPRLSLRGELSENGTAPLVLVDGVEMPLEMLDPSVVEGVTVLKNAAAAAIYGARAAAGAIIIRTRNAGGHRLDGESIRVDAFTGISTCSGSGADWSDPAFNNTRLTQNYKVSAHGGNDSFSYYIGGHYYGQDGLISKSLGQSGYDKVGIVGNFNSRINRWMRYSMGFNYTYRGIMSPFWGSDSAFFDAVTADPSTPYVTSAADGHSYSSLNSHYVMMKNSLIAEIAEGLDFEVSYAFANKYDFVASRSVPVEGVDDIISPNWFGETRERISDTDADVRLSFDRTFGGRHHVMALAGADTQSGAEKYVPASVGMLIDPSISVLTVGDGNVLVDETKGKFRQMGAFARAAYAYDRRYDAELTFRADETSKLPKATRLGLSGAASIGWDIAAEDFFSNVRDAVGMLKLKYSFASVADEALMANYAYLASVNPEAGASPFLSERNNGPRYYPALNFGVYDALSPERVNTHELGIDASFLSDRLSFTGDVYYRTVDDMLTQNAGISAIYGDKAPYMNFGDAAGKGFELGLGWEDSIGTNPLTYSVKAYFADHKSSLSGVVDPRMSYSAVLGLRWMGFDLSALCNGIGRYDWPSDGATVDASYFCLRNLKLGYTFSFKKEAVVKSMHIGLTAQNLFCTELALPAGFGPATGCTGVFYPMSAFVNLGINF